jgi:diguanylate cyclase (GGDEF)-like protein/PAS domain S-box-containing protein
MRKQQDSHFTLDGLFYKNLLDNLTEGVYFLDLDRRITYWNKAAEELTGYPSDEVIGRRCADNILVHCDDKGTSLCEVLCPVAATIASGERREAEVYLKHRDGHRVPIVVRAVPIRRPDNGDIIGAVEIFSDNSSKAQYVREIDELKKKAVIDPLTGLANRSYAETNIMMRMNELARHDAPFGIIFMDIDRFKDINDTHGHDVGDKVLQMVANTLVHASRTFDVVARWGGEEFVASVANISSVQLRAIANRFHALVRQSRLTLDSGTLAVTVSGGATLAQVDDTMETLIKRADSLMYESKLAGRNTVTFG